MKGRGPASLFHSGNHNGSAALSHAAYASRRTAIHTAGEPGLGLASVRPARPLPSLPPGQPGSGLPCGSLWSLITECIQNLHYCVKDRSRSRNWNKLKRAKTRPAINPNPRNPCSAAPRATPAQALPPASVPGGGVADARRHLGNPL